MLPPKVCPECREEYLHSASVCTHCDVALVHESELPSASAELPPASELRLVRAASVGFARSYSERLSEAGIPHRIEALDAPGAAAGRRAAAGTCGVYVRPRDAEAALRIDDAHLRTQIPDLPDDLGSTDPSGESCPACGEPIEAAAAECASCGLPFLDAE